MEVIPVEVVLVKVVLAQVVPVEVVPVEVEVVVDHGHGHDHSHGRGHGGGRRSSSLPPELFPPRRVRVCHDHLLRHRGGRGAPPCSAGRVPRAAVPPAAPPLDSRR